VTEGNALGTPAIDMKSPGSEKDSMRYGETRIKVIKKNQLMRWAQHM
jgi:hypothetical protein